MVVGYRSPVLVSTDGVDWTAFGDWASILPGFHAVGTDGATWAVPGRWVALGGHRLYVGGEPATVSSTDGLTWTARAGPVTLTDVVAAGGRHVVRRARRGPGRPLRRRLPRPVR
jgi:hypothetical protein